MKTYTAVTDAAIDQDSPMDEDLWTLYRDNPIAMLEGAAGAPRVALKSAIGSFTTGNLDFNSLDGWGGVWFSCGANNSSGASTRGIAFDATDDGGSTYLGVVTLYMVPVTSSVQLVGFFDFATGVVHGTYQSTSAAGTFTQTIAGASTSINGVRFNGATDITAGVMIHPNGGETTS